MTSPRETERRRPGANGVPVVLSDGQPWLLATPEFRPRPEGLTIPLVDRALDAIFESAVLSESLSLCDLWDVARRLLKANYDLSDDEMADLLGVAPGAEGQELAARILDAVFGVDGSGKTYTAWVRASLIANGLSRADISARDLPNVLAVLVATNRTVPLSRFADACRLMDERARLESLI